MEIDEETSKLLKWANTEIEHHDKIADLIRGSKNDMSITPHGRKYYAGLTAKHLKSPECIDSLAGWLRKADQSEKADELTRAYNSAISAAREAGVESLPKR